MVPSPSVILVVPGQKVHTAECILLLALVSLHSLKSLKPNLNMVDWLHILKVSCFQSISATQTLGTGLLGVNASTAQYNIIYKTRLEPVIIRWQKWVWCAYPVGHCSLHYVTPSSTAYTCNNSWCNWVVWLEESCWYRCTIKQVKHDVTIPCLQSQKDNVGAAGLEFPHYVCARDRKLNCENDTGWFSLQNRLV